MVDAKRFRGAAGAHVQPLGIDPNPDATAVKDVRAYSRVHGMLYQCASSCTPRSGKASESQVAKNNSSRGEPPGARRTVPPPARGRTTRRRGPIGVTWA